MSYFRNVQNGGNWTAGRTYTFEYFLRNSYANEWTSYYFDGIITGNVYDYQPFGYNGSLFFAKGYICPTDEWYAGGYWSPDAIDNVIASAGEIVAGTIHSAAGAWYKLTVTVPVGLPTGNYDICHLQVFVKPGNFFTFARENLTITIGPEPPASLPGEGVGEVTQTDAVPTLWGPVVPRPPTYGEDLVFIENEWQTIDGVFAAAGGGRWNQQLIVVGKDVIYFEEIT